MCVCVCVLCVCIYIYVYFFAKKMRKIYVYIYVYTSICVSYVLSWQNYNLTKLETKVNKYTPLLFRFYSLRIYMKHRM